MKIVNIKLVNGLDNKRKIEFYYISKLVFCNKMNISFDPKIQGQFELKIPNCPRFSYLDEDRINYIGRKKSLNDNYYCKIYGITGDMFPDHQNIELCDFWHLINNNSQFHYFADDDFQITCLVNCKNIISIIDSTIIFRGQNYVNLMGTPRNVILELAEAVKKANNK
jgi:hypothetical protein